MLSKMALLNFLSIYLLAIISNVESSRSILKVGNNIPLNDGNSIPPTAYGTYVEDLTIRRNMTEDIIWAIEAGYRHIDTARLYLTEDLVGEAVRNVVKRKIVRRADLFITTKLPIDLCTRQQVIPAVKDALKRLQLEYVDLFLLHTPRNVLNLENYDYLEIWKGLEDAKGMGLAKSIGVSNCNGTEINRLIVNSETIPAVNQIEVNPTFTNLELVAYCQSQNIVVTAYAPFGYLVPRPGNNETLPPTFNDPTLIAMAKKYRVNVSQIVLRYSVGRCIIPIARSINRGHIKLNIDIFYFTLTPLEVLTINEFDRNIKVYLIDDDGLVEAFRESYFVTREYIEENNLTQYL